MGLDRYDIAILTTLQQNGRISKRELADEIGLSASPCWMRMKKLEETGYIEGYRARINYDRIAGFCQVTTLIKLETHRSGDFKRFESAMAKTPEIVQCDAVIGEVDYIIKCITADIDHYQELMDSLLARDIGIHAYFSHVRTKSIKDDETAALANYLTQRDGG